MYSVLSRNPPASAPSSRTPRKSSSFLSLRREKDRPLPQSSAQSSPPSTPRMASASVLDNSRPRSSPASRVPKPRSKPAPSSRAPLPPVQRPHDTLDRPSTSPRPEDSAYAFPTFDSSEDLATPTASSYTYVRARSRTGPSGKSHWDDVLSATHLRFSGSSSTQHTETPPRTPIDYATSRESFEQFPVVVAAPIAGVDVMDALVDGMNGGDGGSLVSSRARLGIPHHHPLYQPPLPTPPPGIVLGGGKPRRTKHKPVETPPSDSSDAEGRPMTAIPRKGRRRTARPPSRTGSDATINTNTPAPFPTTAEGKQPPTIPPRRVKHEIFRAPSATSLPEKATKTPVPSISDIIRAHAPRETQARARPFTARSASLYTPPTYTTPRNDNSETPSPQVDDDEIVSRSSIDSIADEIQQTLKIQAKIKPLSSVPPSSFPKRHSIISDNASIYSPRSDPGGPTPSIYSSTTSVHQPSSPYESNFLTTTSPSQAVAQYLRSARLTTLLKLTRSPHASADNPLTISLSDLGSRTGYPIVMFLGLGCVRHIMGLYDEMAECMGLRLITIDRWGLGRTEPRHKTAKGIMQWADVVEEVLDLMDIDKCSVMAHSAGTPYALSFANKFANRIQGDVCLLAPWVGGSEGGGYKWLKYVPNGILKTAQAAEWRLQAWMIGKPPTIAYEGIGYTAPKDSKNMVNLNATSPSTVDGLPRPSMNSSNGTFSEYDDLRDFEGRFESRSTLGADSIEGKSKMAKAKGPRGFIERFKAPQDDRDSGGNTGKKLKGLRSLGSLKGKGRDGSGKSGPPSPIPSLQLDVELGLETDYGWARSVETASQRSGNGQSRPSTTSQYTRSTGHRSISFSSPKVPMSMPSSPVASTANSTFTASVGPSGSYQVALGNALIAASHAESAKGTHNDLLQILNHDNHPWGFSYSNYPHNVKIWYGDKDEKIAENAVRWMERTMGFDKCTVKVVKGADHGLMYRSSVVIEVFEQIHSEWRSDPR